VASALQILLTKPNPSRQGFFYCASSIRRRLEKLKHRRAGGKYEESIQHVLVAGGSSEASLTISKGRLNRAAIASLPRLVSAAVGMHNGFPSSPRSHWTTPFSVWWRIEWVLALLATGHGVLSLVSVSSWCLSKKKPASLSLSWWTPEIRRRVTVWDF
jgi:hypothetical protein